MKFKRLLYLAHRWFGILMCLMFFLWFTTGIVMMYVEYPELTERERMDALPTLNMNAVQVEISSIEAFIPDYKALTNISISSHLNRPIYQLKFTDGSLSHIYADTGGSVTETTQQSAELSATIFAQHSDRGNSASYITALDMDQWTVYGGFSEHRPLHKVAINDDAGTIVYISNLTGRILRDTDTWERGWNWVGSTIHWIYPMQLRKFPDAWVNVVIVVSSLGVIAVITGTVVGILRLRVKNRYKNGLATPYSGMHKWHHLLGIAFTLFVTMFIVSGLFSMNPFDIFNDKSSAMPQIIRYQGETFNLSGFQTALNDYQISFFNTSATKELSWYNIAGEGVLIAHTDEGRHTVNTSAEKLASTIRNAAQRMLPNQSLVELTKLEKFDNHYYSTHNRYRPLPAYRAKFNDDEKTWYYFDAETGELLSRSTHINRLQRWLYNGLHSLDFQILLAYRPVWDIIVIILSLAGIALSYTSVVIAWRRLKKTKFIRKKKTPFLSPIHNKNTGAIR